MWKNHGNILQFEHTCFALGSLRCPCFQLRWCSCSLMPWSPGSQGLCEDCSWPPGEFVCWSCNHSPPRPLASNIGQGQGPRRPEKRWTWRPIGLGIGIQEWSWAAGMMSTGIFFKKSYFEKQNTWMTGERPLVLPRALYRGVVWSKLSQSGASSFLLHSIEGLNGAHFFVIGSVYLIKTRILGLFKYPPW